MVIGAAAERNHPIVGEVGPAWAFSAESHT